MFAEPTSTGARRRPVATTKQQLWTASRDPITGLYNRTFLTDRITKALARFRRDIGVPVLTIVGIVGFAFVGADYGPTASDAALVAVADELTEIAYECDTVARYACSGGMFAVLSDGRDRTHLLLAANASRTLHVGGHDLKVRTVAGTAHAMPTYDAEQLYTTTERAFALACTRRQAC